MNVPIPQISVDAVSYLKPELIGLAAWLGMHGGLYSGDRAKILAHVAATGAIAGVEGEGVHLSEADRARATAAHSDWQDYLAASDTTPVRPLLPAVHRNGHSLPPVSGGSDEADARRLDTRLRALGVSSSFGGHPAQEDDCGDDIAF